MSEMIKPCSRLLNSVQIFYQQNAIHRLTKLKSQTKLKIMRSPYRYTFACGSFGAQIPSTVNKSRRHFKAKGQRSRSSSVLARVNRPIHCSNLVHYVSHIATIYKFILSKVKVMNSKYFYLP